MTISKTSEVAIIHNNGLGWLSESTPSQAELDKFDDPEFIYDNLIINNHISVIVAPPNGGKTTIMYHVAGVMAAKGYDVTYVNSDVAPADAKALSKIASTKGFRHVLPDIKGSYTILGLVGKLIEDSNGIEKYDKCVFIFDTLKKLCNVINKPQVKELFAGFRTLTGKGMTIILLGHTNKYKDKEGKPMFEGTGDVRADVDELIYLTPQKHPDGSITITTDPDKIRGTIKPITFKIDADRNVTLADEVVDTAQANIIEQEVKKDKIEVAHILSAIESGSKTQKDIIDYCKDNGVGERIVRSLLLKYSDGATNELPKQWKSNKGVRNSIVFSLLA